MYAIVDIETTGGNAASGFITEVAIIIHDGRKIVCCYETLINPDCTIPPFITSLTGISNAMTAYSPLFNEVAEEIFNLLNGNIFIAHNVNFDYSYLKYHLSLAGFNLNVKKLCTVRLSRKVFPTLPSYSLGNLCKSLNIVIEDRHRAGGDAKATTILFEMMLANEGMKHVDSMLKRNSSEQWLPLNLEKESISTLPECAGVYYFHDNKENIIYVGKAINIKKRVKSHFTGTDDGARRQQFARKITKITFKTCANELHALVLESTEIKRLWPKYNYSQKQITNKYALYSYIDNRGFIRLAVDKKRKNIPALYQFNLLQEGKVMLRKLTEEFELNPYLCFLKDLEDNIPEDFENYNLKVKKAIKALDEKLPTYVVVDDAKDSKTLCLLIDRGCFWGMGYVDEISTDINLLKEKLEPYADNDFIRTSIYNYVEANPEKVRKLNTISN